MIAGTAPDCTVSSWHSSPPAHPRLTAAATGNNVSVHHRGPRGPPTVDALAVVDASGLACRRRAHRQFDAGRGLGLLRRVVLALAALGEERSRPRCRAHCVYLGSPRAAPCAPAHPLARAHGRAHTLRELAALTVRAAHAVHLAARSGSALLADNPELGRGSGVPPRAHMARAPTAAAPPAAPTARPVRTRGHSITATSRACTNHHEPRAPARDDDRSERGTAAAAGSCIHAPRPCCRPGTVEPCDACGPVSPSYPARTASSARGHVAGGSGRPPGCSCGSPWLSCWS